jgi:hypothetical protein
MKREPYLLPLDDGGGVPLAPNSKSFSVEVTVGIDGLSGFIPGASNGPGTGPSYGEYGWYGP